MVLILQKLRKSLDEKKSSKEIWEREKSTKNVVKERIEKKNNYS